MNFSKQKLVSMTFIWKMAEDGADVDTLMEEVGELQDRLESRDFYTLDAKIDEVARALGAWTLAWIRM